MGSTPSFEATYAEETRALLIARLRVALSVGLVLYAGFYLLDSTMHPELAGLFMIFRGAVVALSAITVGVTYTAWGQRWILPLSIGILVLASLAITVMTAVLGGFSSDYYIGNMLVLFFVGLFMPWPLQSTILFCVLLSGPYFALNGWLYGASAYLLSPLFFLIGTSAFTCLATIAGHHSRRRDLEMRLKLEKANDDLHELDEAKMRFFANVSHELRTPLMLISGPLGELLNDEKSDHRRGLLESMSANTDRLTRHVNMILDVARIEAGRMHAKLAPDNVGEAVSSLVLAAQPYAATRGIALTMEGVADIPDSMFDREHIETLAANLLSNAIKFTPSGGSIDVRGFFDDTQLGFEVQDSGVGIPEDQQDQIFDRFFQVDGGDNGKGKGTGLGLALCRELAKLHGGLLTVTSTPGEGACFRVELPLAPPEHQERRTHGRRREDQMAQAQREGALATSSQARPHGRALLADLTAGDEHVLGPEDVVDLDESAPRILVVEDNPELRAYLVRILSAEYRVQCAADGEAGLEAARERLPDLIVSDVMMPRMTGTEMVQALAKDPVTSGVPVILLTAKAGDSDIVDGLERGAIDYITKPFDPTQLRARIAAQLRAYETRKELDERDSRLAAVGQMTSQIAHDLRGPLTAIVGHTELIRMDAEGQDMPELMEDVDAVERAAKRAVHMIQEVVDYVREGSIPIQRESTHLGDLVDTVSSDMSGSLEQVGIALTVEQHGGYLELPVDRGRIQRVVENLVNNAREAITGVDGPQGSERNIWIRVAGSELGVQIRVADDGPGVPQDVAGELFTPFVTAGKEKGTGLGLAIVRNLVAAHGGTVALDVEPPEVGAAFTVNLPRPTTM